MAAIRSDKYVTDLRSGYGQFISTSRSRSNDPRPHGFSRQNAHATGDGSP